MDQLELLRELGDLAKKEANLTETIENNRRMAEKIGLGRDRGVAKTIKDDEEFDLLLSVQSIHEREQVRDRIRSIINSLIAAGLGDLDLIKRQAANYGV